jgi:hypothetical protein
MTEEEYWQERTRIVTGAQSGSMSLQAAYNGLITLYRSFKKEHPDFHDPHLTPPVYGRNGFIKACIALGMSLDDPVEIAPSEFKPLRDITTDAEMDSAIRLKEGVRSLDEILDDETLTDREKFEEYVVSRAPRWDISIVPDEEIIYLESWAGEGTQENAPDEQEIQAPGELAQQVGLSGATYGEIARRMLDPSAEW